MIRDGNIENIPHSVQDIKAFYGIYSPLPTVMRGKAVDKMARTTNQIDEGTKEQRKVPLLTSDIMYTMNGKYLVSVAEPLELMVTVAVKSRSEEHLGQAVTSQIKLLDSRGFSMNRIIAHLEKDC